MEKEDGYFYPFIRCVVCEKITQDWKWVADEDDGEIYGYCKECADN